MCVFCAAIPATLAVGARLNAQVQRKRSAQPNPEQPKPAAFPVKTATGAAVAALVLASIVYHTQIN